MSYSSSNSPRRTRRQRGFGLLESVLCLSLMSLIFLGAMTLILSAGRQTVRTQAQVYATGDAANAIQKVITQIQTASACAMPTSSQANTAESTWIPMGATSLTQFSTTLNGETINTAVQVIAPPIMTPSQNGYTAPVSSLQVLSTSGGYWSAGSANWPAAPCNVLIPGSVAGSTVWLIYRGDPNGTPDPDPTGNPDPKAGTYLWQYQLPANSSFNPASYPQNLSVLCKSVSTAPNAVQFVRPYYALTGPEQTQLEIKIISGFYSAINGQQTSEVGNGASSSQLTGKCVFMRDHYVGSIPPPLNEGNRTGNNVFQYH